MRAMRAAKSLFCAVNGSRATSVALALRMAGVAAKYAPWAKESSSWKMAPTRATLSFATAARTDCGVMMSSVTALRNVYGPIRVRWLAVRLVPKLTTLAAFENTQACSAWGVSVGPKIIRTFSFLMSWSNTFCASAGVPLSSTITSSILRPSTPPAALICSSASFRPLAVLVPFTALGPLSVAETPRRMVCWAAAGHATSAASSASRKCASRKRCIAIWVLLRGDLVPPL